MHNAYILSYVGLGSKALLKFYFQLTGLVLILSNGELLHYEQSNEVLNTDVMGLGLISLQLIGLRNLSPRSSPFKTGNHCFIRSESMQARISR